MLRFFSRSQGATRPLPSDELLPTFIALDDELDDMLASPGVTRRWRAQLAQKRDLAAQREATASAAIRQGFAACDQRLVESMPGCRTAERLRACRATHKEARREVLCTAIALYGRDAVDRVLQGEHRQSAFRDYDIPYAER